MSESKSSAKFTASGTPKNSTPSIMSAPVEKPKLPLMLALSIGCAVCTSLAIFAFILMFTANARSAQLERDIEDYKNTILDLKNQINELDK